MDTQPKKLIRKQPKRLTKKALAKEVVDLIGRIENIGDLDTWEVVNEDNEGEPLCYSTFHPWFTEDEAEVSLVKTPRGWIAESVDQIGYGEIPEEAAQNLKWAFQNEFFSYVCRLCDIEPL